MRLRALVVLLVLLLVGCGGAGEERGSVRLWVTRDRGTSVLLDTQVEAGQTLMRALASKAEVKTRYGGRYLQALNGIEGSLSGRRDWFWFVNGYEGDRSAAEYRLRDGDVVWWDYREWQREGEARVVVGAFPEPFVHGYAGKTRPAVVRYAPGAAKRAERLADLVASSSVEPLGTAVPPGANVLEVRTGKPQFRAKLRGESAGDPVRFVLGGAIGAYAHRYRLP